MFEFFYELFFTPSFDLYQDFVEKGYVTGGFICLLVSLISCCIYYFYFGRVSRKSARLRKWFFVLILTILLVFFITLYWISFKIFYIGSWSDIPNDIWMFSILNSVYSGILFFLLSWLFKRYSNQTYKIPF